MEANGRDLVEFWSFTAEKGLMNSNTAGSIKSACREVLAAVEGDGWEGVDLRQLDVEDVVQRFERLRMGRFKPASLAVYKARFKNGVQMYLDYLKDPSGWRYTAERPAKDRKKSTASKPGSQNGVGQYVGGGGDDAQMSPTGVNPTGVNFIDYPFPLRPGVVVKLRLPDDMTNREAERLGSYLKSLAYEAPRELMPGPIVGADS